MNTKQYRDHLYQERSHPRDNVSYIGATNDSFSSLYLSLFGFLAAEYFAEVKYEHLPSGILFPVGFLFFWAFYYTYYQPGYLEQKLSSDKKWDLFGIPTTIISTCIWFVKIIFVELIENIVGILFGSRHKHEPVKPQKSKPKTSGPSRTSNQVPPRREFTAEPRTGDALPRDLGNALSILGLPYCRDWSTIQKRYRELAKQYHPDLNPELTTVGNRFMIYDAAYRKLEASKSKYFNSAKVG